MVKPVCQVIDFSELTDEVANYAYVSNVEEQPKAVIDEWKTKWPSGIVTYEVISTENVPEAVGDWVHRALTIALRTWGLRIKDIRFSRDRDPNKVADIILQFRKREEDDLFTTNRNVLAYAYFPTNSPVGGDITFNASLRWTKDGSPVDAHDVDPINYPEPGITTFKTYNIIHTLIHEVGHALGLKHNPDCRECVMFPYYNEQVTLNQNDIERIQNFYGARNLRAWWDEYWKNRMLSRFSSRISS